MLASLLQSSASVAWKDVLANLESVLWMKTPHEQIFQQRWEELLNGVAKSNNQQQGQFPQMTP